MITVIENTTRTVQVISATIPVEIIGAEEKMLSEVDAIVACALPERVYTIELQLFNGDSQKFVRKRYAVESKRLKDALERTIKGSLDGAPWAPYPFASEVTSDTTHMRVLLIEV